MYIIVYSQVAFPIGTLGNSTIVQHFNYINTELPKIWMKYRVLSLADKGFKCQSFSSDYNILPQQICDS